MSDFAEVWRAIQRLEGATFWQKTGKSFEYTVTNGCVIPSTTNRQLARSQFERAYQRLPVEGPGELHDLQGPSYLYAILTDQRVISG